MPPNPAPHQLWQVCSISAYPAAQACVQVGSQPAFLSALSEAAGKRLTWSLPDIINHWQMLTQRQKQVVALFCQGNSTRQIAHRLGVAASTARSHLSRAFNKFGRTRETNYLLCLRIGNLTGLLGNRTGSMFELQPSETVKVEPLFEGWDTTWGCTLCSTVVCRAGDCYFPKHHTALVSIHQRRFFWRVLHDSAL
jgi:DNA-binding CsgD family transcriptional regulator